MDTRQRRRVGPSPYQYDGDHKAHYGDDVLPSRKARNERKDKLGGMIRALILIATVAVATVLYMIFFMPSPIGKLQPYSLPSPPDLSGPLAANSHLVHTQRLYEGQVRGPESMVLHQGVLYTGTADGKVLVIEKGEVRILTTFGQPPCGKTTDEPNCGRPLGMRVDRDGYLVVVDTYKGLYKVNMATGDKHQLFPASMEIDGWTPHFLNDLDITTEGIIYLTDSCKHWRRRHFLYCLMQGTADGRLIKYDPVQNTSEVLMNNMLFANGVQLSRKQDYLLVAETGKARILKYHLTGPRSGEVEVFADNLPGLPDNIRRCARGGYWVGLATCRHSSSFSLLDFMASRPWTRKVAALFFSIEGLQQKIPACAIVLRVDDQGNIVGSLQDLDGRVINGVSEVLDDMDTLYFGSYKSPFIGMLKSPLT